MTHVSLMTKEQCQTLLQNAVADYAKSRVCQIDLASVRMTPMPADEAVHRALLLGYAQGYAQALSLTPPLESDQGATDGTPSLHL